MQVILNDLKYEIHSNQKKFNLDISYKQEKFKKEISNNYTNNKSFLDF